MFRFLWSIPGVLFGFFVSLFFPAQPRPVPVAPTPEPDPAAPSEESQAVGHEVTDASAKTMLVLVAVLFTVIIGTMVALGWMYTHLYTTDQAMPVTVDQGNFQHGQRTKTSIAKDWDIINAQAGAHLDDYGWADRKGDVVRVPIARAMELVSKEGLPARAGQTTPYFPPSGEEKLPLTELESNTNANSYDPSR